MFNFRTYIKPSNIHGLGVFAAEFIPNGSVIWQLSTLDRKINEQSLQLLPENAKEYIKNYAYFSKGYYILCFDNAKYTNHSIEPNMKGINHKFCLATRNIYIGEEITENYYLFDEMAANKLR
jgi:SET domain-containing protein